MLIKEDYKKNIFDFINSACNDNFLFLNTFSKIYGNYEILIFADMKKIRTKNKIVKKIEIRNLEKDKIVFQKELKEIKLHKYSDWLDNDIKDFIDKNISKEFNKRLSIEEARKYLKLNQRNFAIAVFKENISGLEYDPEFETINDFNITKREFIGIYPTFYEAHYVIDTKINLTKNDKENEKQIEGYTASYICLTKQFLEFYDGYYNTLKEKLNEIKKKEVSEDEILNELLADYILLSGIKYQDTDNKKLALEFIVLDKEFDLYLKEINTQKELLSITVSRSILEKYLYNRIKKNYLERHTTLEFNYLKKDIIEAIKNGKDNSLNEILDNIVNNTNLFEIDIRNKMLNMFSNLKEDEYYKLERAVLVEIKHN